jgi:putative transposase
MYHIVWIPKYRRKVMVSGVSGYCDKVIRGHVIERYPDVIIEELTVQVDHIHMMVVIPPKYSIATVIGDIKRSTSLAMRKKFGYLREIKGGMWSTGYFVSSVGLNEEKIRKYIKYQDQQDKGQAVSL